ncbi:MAG: hypothetical protein Ct9H90mP18_01280 [Gammaproteobacteria bacterium]|nr:MAG: hypothetical protein Ct9H90mP18_01280 [Gammaproteobacteria bacterium]
MVFLMHLHHMELNYFGHSLIRGIAWHLISVIDPIFTIPILLFIMTAVIKNKKLYSYFALGWLVIYLFLSYSSNIELLF